MNKCLRIREAAQYLGVSTQTLRRWGKNRKMIPAHRTQGGQRRYSGAQLRPCDVCEKTTEHPTIAYPRVSSHDQKEDLQRQVHMLEMYFSAKGWPFSVRQFKFEVQQLKLLNEQTNFL